MEERRLSPARPSLPSAGSSGGGSGSSDSDALFFCPAYLLAIFALDTGASWPQRPEATAWGEASPNAAPHPFLAPL
uniref:Uncharacterized protein n=1 Tax=Oryza sativa subsp. japonica TaxID=39947 RepID=Q6YWA4_ORYSJ|nr:hypothetical protein [Oryza sativa Japonica Group]